MDYSCVFLCILLFLWQHCLPTNGACRCRNQAQCDRPFTHCVAGCETGFAGNRCQYVNQLAFASCTMGQRSVDSNLGTCTSGTRLKCSFEGPARKFNIIRIFYGRDKGKGRPLLYILLQRNWKQVSFYRNVTNKITDFKYNRKQKFSNLTLDLRRNVCEVAVTYECLGNGACDRECNCKNASDCLGSPGRCPSGCAEGYIHENNGCKQKDTSDSGRRSTSTATMVSSATSNTPTPTKDTTDRGQISTSRAILLSSATSKTSPTQTDSSDSGRKSTSTATMVSSATSNTPTPTECPKGYYGANCASTCSPGCVSSSCDRKDGKCLPSGNTFCKTGWKRGSYSRCDECDRDKYGVDCRQNCSPGCVAGGCNSSTGVCPSGRCKPGWRNANPQLERCDQKCPKSYYGANCASTCSPGCVSSSCDRKDGKCVPSGYTYCKPGWKRGSYYRCDECDSGKYGVDCRQNCSSGCAYTGCNSSSGVCRYGRCNPGWRNANPQLERCDQICDTGTYGQGCTKKCNIGCEPGSCHHVTGSCNSQCQDGWTGGSCERACGTRYYGPGCRKTCSVGCKRRSCNRFTGDCDCKNGWTGHQCQNHCSGNTYVDGQVCSPCGAGCNNKCNKNNGYCRCRAGWLEHYCNQCSPGFYMDKGNCVTCGAGWTGPRCATPCVDGTYGPGCRETCSVGCKGQRCNLFTGDCDCKNGWTGQQCENQCRDNTYVAGQVCSPCGAGCDGLCDKTSGYCRCTAGWMEPYCNICVAGRYGQRCGRMCNEGCTTGSCNHVTGDCDCKDGWTGWQCQYTCVDGRYGPGCTETCNKGCKPGSCDHVSGDCDCKDGWTGQSCEQTCGAGTYGPGCAEMCNEGCKLGSCNHVTGDCDCTDGWRGYQCKTKCWKGWYGAGCNNKCGSECQSCHHVSGSCAGNCKSGWHGENCTSRCPPGVYGHDCKYQCNEGCQPEKCDSVHGLCGTSCRAGWTGENCVNVCSPWTYGENCLQDCSVGCVNQTCDRTIGRCDVCLDGWEHEDLNITRCDKECDDGRYGENCKDDCSIHCINATCHHVNGSCTHGCLDGRSGVYCEVSEAGHLNVNLIVGLLLFLIVVIAVVMCVILFREPLRRFKDKKTEKRRTDGMSLPMAARGGQDASEQLAVNDEDEAIYVNVPSSVPVAVSAFKEFVARKKATKEILVKEYAELPKGLTAIHDKAVTKVNSPKNRFKGIYPYNHSLVVLKRNGGRTGYINASYIDGRTRGKQYIATQGPLPHTVVDFWEMIWQEQVPVIVMLANIVEDGRRRCEPYWPSEQGEDTKTFGPWKITVADSCPLADFTIRTLTIKKGHMQRTVKHVHYMVWPDKDVPDNTMSLVELRNKVRTFSDLAQGPMVVHCSAGVGRTGTLIALDSLIEDAETRNMVDIYGCVWRLRTCRVSMVQTQSQYVFLHDCLLDALCNTVHPTPASLYDNAYKQLKNNERSPNLAVAYQKLCECPETDHVSDAARDLENIGKNRNKNILPGDKHRPILLTREAEGTDYINAVIAPSYEKRGAFILTQIPLTSTVVDFWRLVRDYDVRGIVLLENYTDMDANCGVFWAKDKKPTKFGPFSVSEGRTEEHTGFTVEKICYSLGKDGREVTVFRSPAWPKKSSLPDSPSSLLGLIDFLRQWNAGAPSPLLVVCRDGATRSGLFCVLASAVQRLLLEKEVALQQTIRSIRFVRKQVIPNLEQFEFCYDSVKAYMDSFQEYSNFA